MAIEKVSEHIWSIRTWMIIPVTVWLVEESDGLTFNESESVSSVCTPNRNTAFER